MSGNKRLWKEMVWKVACCSQIWAMDGCSCVLLYFKFLAVDLWEDLEIDADIYYNFNNPLSLTLARRHQCLATARVSWRSSVASASVMRVLATGNWQLATGNWQPISTDIFVFHFLFLFLSFSCFC
ncbi:hypothetical protein L1049_001391 [Liquidambar formosana]|uniref:Uncharacterized protein n=1 Tax=Liquidambar formosana TaxID=63359 RepID=A0AAP0NEL9_LIQFO